MKKIEGYEQTDYFSQEIILDYIDGRLSPEATAAFEQQMQEDEALQLAVEGIRGFYFQEQKDRTYLEDLLANSEDALKGALARENAQVVKLAARRRQNMMGIAMAACVALLMVFSVPYLLNQVEKKESAKGIAVVKPQADKAAPEAADTERKETKRSKKQTNRQPKSR